LIGDGIGPSLTPDIHMIEGKALGLRYNYDRFDTSGSERLETALRTARTKGYAGLNITHPHKKAVVTYLDRLEGIASEIKTVNTVIFRDGQAIGWNTDYLGFKVAWAHNIGHVEGQVVHVVGAGGAGLAVVLALLDSGAAKVAISDLNPTNAEALIADVRGIRPLAILECVDLPSTPDGATAVVNCTPMGMADHPGTAVDPTRYRQHAWVADIVYFPLNTLLVQKARNAGMRVMDGSGMALWQAVEAFQLITGHRPNASRMQDSLQRLLVERREFAAQ
jgi:shikimate dehydrogenase